jgi:tRNA(adenine34) deaminase
VPAALSDLPGEPGDEALMRRALAAGALAGAAGDVPIGAALAAPDGTVLAVAGNERERRRDPTAHAEVLVIRAAAELLGGWQLTGCTLAVTCEPCTMCAGAIGAARIRRVVFGCWERKTGAVGSLWDVLRDPRLVHRVQVRGGVLADDGARLLTDFFAARRPAR